MKYKYLFLLLFLTVLSVNISAQEKRNQIKTSLIFPLAEMIQFSYERLINDEMSLNFEATLGEIVSLRPSFRFYMSEDKIAPNGTFIGPSLHFLDQNFGGCLMIGHQKLFKSKISLEAFGGPGVYSEGVSFWGGINVGIVF